MIQPSGDNLSRSQINILQCDAEENKRYPIPRKGVNRQPIRFPFDVIANIKSVSGLLNV